MKARAVPLVIAALALAALAVSAHAAESLGSPDTVKLSGDLETVAVVGQVARPGRYPRTEEMTVVDAIRDAGGFADEADASQVTIKHSGGYTSLRADCSHAAEGQPRVSPLLERLDVVFVPRKDSPTYITVVGAVCKPGLYPSDGPVTLIEVLSWVDGFSRCAGEISIIRTSYPELTVDNLSARDLLRKPIVPEPVALPGDIIFVAPGKPAGPVLIAR